jgi:putative peptidoglycan lipid II flippase
MVGLIILREPIVALLFKRGAFDADAARLTAYALLYYGIGLWAFAAVRIVVSTFYALQDTRTPVRMAIISVIANIVLGIILMRYLSHGGLALSTSLASILNLGLLARALRQKLGFLGLKTIAASTGQSLACSTIMGAGVWAIARLIIPAHDANIWGLLLGITGSILAGLIFYGLSSFFIKRSEFERVLTITRKGIRKG